MENKNVEIEAVLKQINNLYRGPDDTEGYPPPDIPTGTKAEIFRLFDRQEVDKRASLEPSDSMMDSFPDLIQHLTTGLNTDLQKLRSVFIWIGKRNLIHGDMYKRENYVKNSPYEYLKEIASDAFSRQKRLAQFFALLCRLAGLPCLVLPYFSRYHADPGDRQTVASCYLNMVYVDGSWRVVVTYSAYLTYTGGGRSDLVLLEEDGQAMRKRDSITETVDKQHLNEDSFLPDPAFNIYFYFPDHEDPRWQLLPQPWTLEQFWNTPFFTYFYLKSNWKLSTKHKSIVEAPSGNCSIVMDKVPERRQKLSYRLYYNERKSGRGFVAELQLKSYVLIEGDNSILTRLPVKGVYMLEILDGVSLLCILRLVYKGKEAKYRPFPPTPGQRVGHSQEAVDAGLVDPSRRDGLIVAQEGEKISFKMHLKKRAQVKVHLNHVKVPSEEMDQRITTKQVDNMVHVTVKVPYEDKNPEYTVAIEARPDDQQDGKFVNVLNYLLTPDRDLVHGVKGKEMMLRDELAAALEDDDLHRLESALREFRLNGLKDEGATYKAFSTLCRLHQTALEKAITDGSATILDTAISDVDLSRVAPLVHQTELYRKAKDALLHRRRLDNAKDEVQRVGPRQVSEVQSYNRPHDKVRTVLVATYLLLGEKEDKLKNWVYVRSLLRKRGRQGILSRILQHDPRDTDLPQRRAALQLLVACSEEEIRSLSVGAAAFYRWSKATAEAGEVADQEEAKTENSSSQERFPPLADFFLKEHMSPDHNVTNHYKAANSLLSIPVM